MSLCLIFTLLFVAQSETPTFIAPSQKSNVTITYKVTDVQSDVGEINIEFIPAPPNTLIDEFSECMRGPDIGCVLEGDSVWICRGVHPSQYSKCRKFDYDGDGDVDFDDFAIFQNQYIEPESEALDFKSTGDRIMLVYLNPLDRRGYESLPLIPTLNDEFTAICLHGWSWHRYPDMFDDPEIQTAMAAIKASGKKLLIGRDLWPRWMPQAEKDSWATSRALPFDDKWIREELEGAVAEKKKYGAWATFIDVEPYGQNRTVDDGSEKVFEGSRHMLKAHERTHGWELAMTIHERRIFAETLARVREDTGLSYDFVYPSTSGASDRYQWACREIGKYACNSKCYYLKDITDRVIMGSDPGYPRTVPVWFSAVTNPSMTWGNSTTLDPDQVRHIWSQWDQGKLLHPELKTFMVFSGTTLQKAVLEAFQRPSP